MAVSPRTSGNNLISAAVISSTRNPVYAKQKLFLLMWRRLFSPCLLLPFVLLAFSQSTLADSYEDSARSLARKINIARKNLINYNWQNRSSLSPAISERLRMAFQSEMQRLQNPAELYGSSQLSILITEDPTHLHLIAYLHEYPDGTGKNALTASVSFSKGQATLFEQADGPLRLDRQLLWQQPQPILDLAQSKDPNGKPDVFVVLGRETLTLYRWNEEQWQFKDSVPFPRVKPPQRSLVGEIHLYDHFYQFHLPGIECDGDGWQKLIFECDEEPGIWSDESLSGIPLSLEPAHNFFAVNPHYIGSAKLPLAGFFSWDGWPGDNRFENRLVLAAVDGHAYIYSPESESHKTPESLERLTAEWGSDLVSIGCDDKPIIIATSASDHASRDTLQGFEIEGSTVRPVTATLDFPGPILNLKLLDAPHEDALLAIVSNLTTGNYEAYRVTVACRE